eukprot:Gb_10993 [translate_table: standard]
MCSVTMNAHSILMQYTMPASHNALQLLMAVTGGSNLFTQFYVFVSLRIQRSLPFPSDKKEFTSFILFTKCDLSLSFKEAVFGVEKNIEIFHLETCGVCMGSRARSSANISTCQDCKGRGSVMETQRTSYGIFSQAMLDNAFGSILFYFLVVIDWCPTIGIHRGQSSSSSVYTLEGSLWSHSLIAFASAPAFAPSKVLDVVLYFCGSCCQSDSCRLCLTSKDELVQPKQGTTLKELKLPFNDN